MDLRVPRSRSLGRETRSYSRARRETSVVCGREGRLFHVARVVHGGGHRGVVNGGWRRRLHHRRIRSRGCDSQVGDARTERARGWGTRAMNNAERAVRGESRACVMNEMCDGYDRGETGVVGNARTQPRESGRARESARDERMDARERERITKGWRRPCSRTSFVRNRRMCPP